MLLSAFAGAPYALANEYVLVPTTGSAQEARKVSALEPAVVRFAGMASGSYYWADGLLAEQLLTGLASRPDRAQQALPDGQRLLSSRREFSDGAERAAVLLDARGDVLAAALVHQQCGKTGLTICQDSQHGVLSVFLRPGIDRAQAEPLVAWSQDVPKDLMLGRGGKIATVETITLDASRTGASPVRRPNGFSPQVPLYPRAILYRTGQEALSNARARRVVRLQTTDSIEQVLAFYKRLSPPLAEMEAGVDDNSGYVSGKRKGVAFSVEAQRNEHFPSLTNVEVEIAD
ncbi:hypothetical protein OR16_06504 [Cupriavidus basilensis OR16]|uniref:Uncharacterized protein n=1 Tax=Cupriavidus basilensis OR16 TaxID=1127483 RepID=H1S1B9_9BURK|nr:hypothetical protein [Cupriavidus basilensis]EHP43732.1 hypothetical protein OR16_06504 [Cupriavidus basilensis OR16]